MVCFKLLQNTNTYNNEYEHNLKYEKLEKLKINKLEIV